MSEEYSSFESFEQEAEAKAEIIGVHRDNPLLSYFWQSLDEEKYVPIPTNDTERTVKDLMDVVPLTPLKEEESAFLEKSLQTHVASHIEQYNKEIEKLLGGYVYLVPKEVYEKRENGKCNTEFAIFVCSTVDAELERLGCQPTKPKDLERYFSSPSIWDQTRFVDISEPGFKSSRSYCWPIPGSRPLYYPYKESNDSYYRTKEDFIAHINDVKVLTGKDSLRMLDIGGNLGRALRDAKEIDPTIETYNMTIDEAPSVYGDHIVRHPAELMPAEFEEHMDIIESNISFRYFAYQDIALLNVVKALSIGGQANIDLGGDRTLIEADEFIERMRSMYVQLRTLEEQGYITLDIWKINPKEGMDDATWFAQEVLCIARGKIKIKKNKSVKGLV